jgi:hypothetical protein
MAVSLAPAFEGKLTGAETIPGPRQFMAIGHRGAPFGQSKGAILRFLSNFPETRLVSRVEDGGLDVIAQAYGSQGAARPASAT